MFDGKKGVLQLGKSLIKKIKLSDSTQINEVLSAAQNRYRRLFPEWEIYYISIEKSQDRNEQIDQVIEFLNRLKKKEAP